ncbi:FHA domain-containing protein [Phormidesmis sp. 146-33]
MPFLIIRDEDETEGAEEIVSLKNSEYKLGRDQKSDIRIDYPFVSLAHAVIRATADGIYRLIDNESTNGTFINGSRLKGFRDLEDKDSITLSVNQPTIYYCTGEPPENLDGSPVVARRCN